MDAHKLVKMANEIGAFFEAEPDHQVALQGIAGHLRRFWDPRMRRQLLAFLDEQGGDGLRPAVREALQVHRDNLAPAPAAPAGASPAR